MADNALSFNANTTYVTFPSISAYNFTANSTFSFMCWFKHSASANSTQIFIKKASVGTSGYKIFLDNSNKYFKFEEQSASFTSARTASSSITIADGSVNHMAMTYNGGTNTLKFYLNGVSLAITDNLTWANITSNTTSAVLIGGDGGANASYSGVLDEVMFYNTELSQSDITNAFNKSYQTTGRKFYAPFNEGTGTTTSDTINSNNGTLTNTPTWVAGINNVAVLDTTTVSTDQTTSPITWNHTVGTAGSNVLLIVGVTLSATTSGPTASGVTYNGVAMTKVRADTHNTANSIIESSIWFLFAPASGTNQVSVSFTGGTLPHGAGISASYYGAQQSSTADASSGTNGTASGDQTFTVTTVANNSLIFSVGINAATTSPTMAADVISRGTVSLAATIPAILRGQESNPVSPAGVSTVGFTIGGTGLADWAMTGASFAPFVASVASTPRFRSLLGVGL